MKLLRWKPFVLAGLWLMVAGCGGSGQGEVQYNPDPVHNSRNSLDWQGVYQGVLPCASCEGIKTILSLFGDLTYELSRQYIGKDSTVFTSKGSFEWDETGSRIRLKTPESDQFQVGENRLFMLDSEGNRIQGALEVYYLLQKE